ncbi:MAG: FliM/FliN family flagellar motor switch protein, partial [bacterium]
MTDIKTSGVAGRFGDLSMPLRVRMGTVDVPARELLNLKVGGVLQVDKIVGEPMDIFLGDRLLAHGEIVTVNGRLGVRV